MEKLNGVRRLFPEGSLARQRGHRRIGAALILSAALLIPGLGLPVLETNKFLFITREYSLLGTAWELFADAEYFLAAVTLLFSIIFPVFKLTVMMVVFFSGRHGDQGRRRLIRHVDWLGKWSMADVFVVALIIFAIKTSGLATAAEMPGIYFFAASIGLAIYAAHALGRAVGDGENRHRPS